MATASRVDFTTKFIRNNWVTPLSGFQLGSVKKISRYCEINLSTYSSDYCLESYCRQLRIKRSWVYSCVFGLLRTGLGEQRSKVASSLASGCPCQISGKYILLLYWTYDLILKANALPISMGNMFNTLMPLNVSTATAVFLFQFLFFSECLKMSVLSCFVL